MGPDSTAKAKLKVLPVYAVKDIDIPCTPFLSPFLPFLVLQDPEQAPTSISHGPTCLGVYAQYRSAESSTQSDNSLGLPTCLPIT